MWLPRQLARFDRDHLLEHTHMTKRQTTGYPQKLDISLIVVFRVLIGAGLILRNFGKRRDLSVFHFRGNSDHQKLTSIVEIVS